METIKASELYIDKYYYQVVEEYEPCTPKIIKWNQSNWYAIGECIEFIEWFEPIPITEEWLIKFGFEKNSYWFKDDNMLRFGLIDNKLHCSIGNDENGFLYNRINYIHQLQNLYFALTGQELEFKQ
jgi:hypothetical protein